MYKQKHLLLVEMKFCIKHNGKEKNKIKLVRLFKSKKLKGLIHDLEIMGEDPSVDKNILLPIDCCSNWGYLFFTGSTHSTFNKFLLKKGPPPIGCKKYEHFQKLTFLNIFSVLNASKLRIT